MPCLRASLEPESYRVSHLACIHGCLRYLGVRVTPGWLFGATGHGFLLNVQPDVCVSGPTVYNWEWLMRLVANVGGDVAFVKDASLGKAAERYMQEHVGATGWTVASFVAACVACFNAR